MMYNDLNIFKLEKFLNLDAWQKNYLQEYKRKRVMLDGGIRMG